MDDYFDVIEFRKLLKLISVNPLLARDRFYQYFEVFPNDYTTYTYFIFLLIKLREFEEANTMINNVIEMVNNDKYFSRKRDKYNFFSKNIIMCKLKMFMYMGKYDEFYNMYSNNFELIKNDIRMDNPMVFLCKSRLGLLDNDRDLYDRYIYKQIVEYREEDFLNHIKKHLSDSSLVMKNSSHSIFGSEFPVDSVINEIKKYIPSNKCLCSGFFDNLYVFKYDLCGRDNYKLTDYFKVYTFHNSCDFITMTPSVNCESLPYIDLNYLKENNNKKVKKISQIDKFNKKYNIK